MKEYKVWAFARSAAPNLPALEEQLAEVMREADRRGYIIVNSCMEQKCGTEFWRPDLFAILTAVQQGRVNAVMVQIATHMSSCGPPYRSSDNRWNKNIIARLLSCDIYCGTATYPAIITKELYFQVQQLRNEKSVSYSSVLQSFRDDMQCCCGERLYWYPKTHQWYCRHCGMWSNRIRPEELSQQLREKLFWICRHNERICSPQGASNIHSIESSRLSHEINTLLASPEPDAESIVRKILHRAELQFTCCSAGDADPATLQIKRACNELEPTDTFPLKLYAEIVSNVILYRDTHIEIKLRNGQIL